HLQVGTRVCSIPVLFRPNGPYTVGYSNDNPGGYGEYMRLTEALLLAVPNGLSTERAALTEPMAVGLHAVEQARLDKDDVPLVVGVCMERDTIQPLFGINKELNVQFVLGYSREEFGAMLRHIAEGTIPTEPLITGKVGVEGVAQAFEDLGSPEHHAKILVEPWRS